MEIRDKFGRMSEFSCEYPRGLLVCAFVTHPPDQVQQFTGVMSVIDLGIEDFGDFKLRFVAYHDGRRWGLDSIGDRVWVGGFQHGNMEHWVYSSEAVREP